MDALDDGIAQQLELLAGRRAAGMPRAGWKICVNDARLQRKLGLAASFVGFLDGSRALRSGEAWPVEAGQVLGVEPEFALRFGAAVRAGEDAAAIRRAIDGVAPAIEVVDWRSVRLDLASMAASSSFHAGFVTGELGPLDALPAIADGCPRFSRGEDTLGVPDPALVPADLTVLVAHVAAFLARYGQGIEAGDWLLCGACTNPARVQAGDVVVADFGALGAVAARFER